MNLSTILHILFSKGVKKSFSRTFSLLLVGLLATTITQAADITHNINGGVLNIPGNSTDNYIVTGTGAVTANNIVINAGYKGTVRLKNVNIERSATSSCINVIGQNNLSNNTPITIVDIVLEGTNNLKFTGSYFCGLQVNQGAQINIKAIDPTDNASGVLYSKSTNKIPGAASGTNEGGAGIGAPTSQGAQGTSTIYYPNGSVYANDRPTAGGNIIISSGTITAWGGHAAGIGGGYGTYYNGIIVVYGGIVDSRAGRHAAGIGSGCPNGSGVQQYFADMSAVVAVPPAEITCYGTNSGNDQLAALGLTGTRSITYINDPNKPLITVRTVDDEPDANIYLDLTETVGLENIFNTVGINTILVTKYDLKKVRVGRTNAAGNMSFNGKFDQSTTFFTDASSSKPATLGRPYMPIKKTVEVAETISLPLLNMNIALTDIPSKPLDVGYTIAQAKQNAYRLKIEYNDSSPMSEVNFSLQGGGANFTGITFYASDNATVVSAPTTLTQGNVYYVQIPIVQGKPIGIYSDVLLINGKWKTEALLAPIRKVVTQRVAFDDTNTNTYIKVAASEKKFTVVHPTTKTITLNLNINHSSLSVSYDKDDVTAKYLITTEADYNAALAATPISGWTNMNIPAAENTNTATTVSFSGKPVGTYYVHWNVESGVVYGHSKNVANPPADNGGYGPYKIVPPLQVGTITATNPYVCYGEIPAKITGTLPTSGSGDYSYQWQISTNNSTWTNISGANLQDYTPAVLTVSPTYFRRMDKDIQLSSSTPTASVKIEQYAELKGGTIGSAQSICYNTAPGLLTSTTAGSGGDGNIQYQWQSSANGTSGWANITTNGTSATYQPAALTSTTYYRREVKDGASCGTVYSNTITVTVRPDLLAGVIGSNQTICYNTVPGLLTSTTAGSGGDGNIQYQWQSSANGTSGWANITTNGTSATYQPAALTSTTYYRREVKDGASCGTVYSNTITVTVRPDLLAGAIGSNQTICYNTVPGLLTSTTAGSGGDGNIQYQWQSSANGTSGWANITTNGTSATYQPAALTSTTYYRREVKDGASCGTVYSNTITVTVRPDLLAGVIGSNQTICYNTVPGLLTSTTAGSGGDGNIQYQWQSSANGTSGWANITTNGTSATYQPAALTSTTYYRREVKDGASCGTVYSNTITVTVRPELKAGTISGAQTICYNDTPSQLTGTTGIGGDGNYKYQWQSSANGTNGWANIGGATTQNYAPGVLTATIYYRREVKDNASCGTEYSNVIEVTVHPKVVPGTIRGNTFVCQGLIPLPIQGDVSTGGSSAANIQYKWQSSANGTSDWTYIAGATSKDYTFTSALATHTYFRRVTTDNYCNTFEHNSNIFLIKVVSLPTTLFWKTSADTDNNWNNPNNWVDKNGVQLGMVPLACTDVVIRGGAAKYPSLDASTVTDIYGDPICQNITFEYGAEVAYQHKLTYEKAFVQYNWGYYTGTPANNSQPNNNGSGATCSMNKRDVWYALSAPLKNMASGDFSFGGYPITWQGGFNIPDPVTGGNVGVDAGDFSKVYARNDIDLVETNNAIAIKIPTYKTSTIGCDNQSHMNGIKGVIEFPYFENDAKTQFYPTHSYDKYSLESKFFYFDTKTLQLIYSPVGRMKRGKESYRFVYENASNTAGKINLDGTEVLGYEQSVSKQLASSQKVMVGNPFMASINSKRFLDANNINPANLKIKEAEGYYIFNSTTQTWERKPFSATNNIKAQQAFLVTLEDGITTTTKLMYPLEGTYALTGPTFRGFSMVLPEGSSLYLKASSSVEKAGDYSILNITEPEDEYNIRKMIYTEGHVVPETFFIAADGKNFNLIQAYESGVREIGIGVKCSDTEGMISLTFENANEFYSATGACPVLIDKVTNVRQNLTKDKSYYFKQRAVDVKDKYVDAERFVLRLASPVEIMNSENSDISIVYHQGILDISATDVIKEVLVYDLQGRLVHSNSKVGTISYSKSLNLPQAVYVVKVQTENGKTKVERVMAL